MLKRHETRAPGRWRLYVILALSSVLPLLAFLYAADWLLRRNFTRTLLQQSQLAATTTGDVLEERLSRIRRSLEAMAKNPVTSDAWSRGDLQILNSQLEQSYALRRDAGYLAIYDDAGTLRAIYPEHGNVPSAGLPWLAAAAQHRGDYISGLLTMSIGPLRHAIIVAAALDHPSGFVVGIYGLDAVKDWLQGVPESTTKWVSIVDQNGTQLFGPDLTDSGPLRDLAGQEDVRRVLAGGGGAELVWREGRQSVVSRHRLPSCGWGLLVRIPVTEIDKAIWKVERPVALLGFLFLLVAAGIGSVIAGLHRKLRESEERIRQIVTSTTDAFVGMDAGGNVTELNPQAEALFGWPRLEILGHPLHEFVIPPRYRELHIRGLQRFRETGEALVLHKQLELEALHRDGHEFPVELSISHVRKGRKDYFSAFVRDISERKRAEKEVADLNSELRAQVLQLEARNKELEAFSYSVSHDVRAPLRHILGFSRILAQECGPQFTATGRTHLEQIQASAARMQRLVDDLLRFSRVGEQGLKWQLTPLGDLVAEVISGLKRDLNGRDVTFKVSPLPQVECDPGLATQVFWNLLSNAMKFTATRPHAVISIGQCPDGDEAFFVSDNGVGFDMRHAEKLFRPFQRLHGEEFEGSGVGLATVERIILKHKGRIWAQSKPDSGATFFFTLGPRRAESGSSGGEQRVTLAASGPS